MGFRRHGLSPVRSGRIRTLPDKIMKIGVGGLFATGNDPDRDRIFHVAGMRYSDRATPVAKDWILDPGRNLTRRLYEQSRVGKELRKGKPSWEKAKPDIAPFFADLDVLFLYDRNPQRDWFRRTVLHTARNQTENGRAGRKTPICIDFREIARFFLPDRDLPDDETLIRQSIPETEWNRSDPRLPLLVRSLGLLLQDIIDAIRSESQAKPGYALVYSLLDQAMASQSKSSGRFEDFRAVLEIAGIAHRIHWSDDLFAKPYGDKTPDTIPDTDSWNGLLTREAHTASAPPATETSQRMPEPPDIALLNGSETHRGNGRMPSPFKVDAERSSGETVPPPIVSLEHVDEAFTRLIAETEDFRPRNEQQTFARFCADAINKGGMYAIEAGTGTGKTLGYLIPAFECIRQGRTQKTHGCKVGKIIVATATKNLQDHLLETEWPRLARTGSLYQDFKAAPLKGKNNFLCITAVVDLFEEAYGPIASDRKTGKTPRSRRKRPANAIRDGLTEKRLAWLFLFLAIVRNRGGTENIHWAFFRKRFPDLDDFLDESNASVACTSDLCRMGASCIYPRHLKKAREADIVVTNHYKLPLMDSQIQEPAQVCLIDEADQFPDNLRNAATMTLSTYRIRRRFLQRIAGSERRRGFAQILEDRFVKSLQATGKLIANNDTLEQALSNVQSIRSDCEEIHVLLNSIGETSRDYPDGETRRWATMHPATGKHFQTHLSSLAARFDHIATCWDALLNSELYEDAGNKRMQREKARIVKYVRFAKELNFKASEIANDYPSENFVHICAFRGEGWTLQKIPYDISAVLKETCCKRYATTLFTSATLFVDNRLDLFSDNLGVPFDAHTSERIASPFDYANNVKGFVTNSIPPYWSSGPAQRKSRWRKEAAGALARLAVALNGRTLALFTSTEEMRDVYEQVRPVLERYGIDPLLQDGSSLAEINAFRTTEHSVLFGVDRFWTGVDFPGPTLSQVVVVRLPNPNLGDPLIAHRQECMGDTFWEKYYRPTTKLKLRQGFGRLIRSEKDKGLFVALDQRLWSNERMRNLQGAVPVRLHRRSTEPDEMDWFIDEGLVHLGLKAEFKDRNIDLRNIKIPDKSRPAASGKPRPAAGRPGQKR